MTAAESMLRIATGDLSAVGARWALIGGLAVAFRTQPRFTMDVDLAVAVAGDDEAQRIVYDLRFRGYYPLPDEPHAEQDYVDRMATVRLVCPRKSADVVVDLLFASSGIEREIVACAEVLKVLPGIQIPVASVGHLIAMKVLAGRPQDLTDLGNLIPSALEADLVQAREGVRLIQARGFHREQDVPAALERFIRQAGR